MEYILRMKSLKCIQKTILTKLKKCFLIFTINIQGFFQYIAGKDEKNINYEILLNKVGGINFYDIYNTLYNYLSAFNLEKTLVKDKLFLEDLSKGFNL